MKADLHLDEEPRHMECFDNSNIQGTNPVAMRSIQKNENLVKVITGTLISRHWKVQTILPVWKR
jgi:excinuclease UvrABC nuclease subunit